MHATEYYDTTWLGYNVHLDTIVISWIVMGFSLVFSLVIGSRAKKVPGYAQSILEMVFAYFEDLARTLIGDKGKKYVPYIISIFFFVLGCNWLGVIPYIVRVGHFSLSTSPTRDVNTTLALALVSFLAFHFYGIMAKGPWKYIQHYIHPIPMLAKSLSWPLNIILIPLTVLFLILNIVEELARVLSLTVRLMGNILGEHIVAGSLVLFVTIMAKLSILAAVPADIMPLFILFLGVLTGAIQAFIFAVLTLSYIAHAVEEEH